MADEQSTDPFDQLMQKNLAQPKTTVGQEQDPFDLVMSGKSEPSAKSSSQQSPEDAAYAAKVESYMPEAREYYKDTNPYVAALKEAPQRAFIIGPTLNEVGADIEAALPSGITGLKGDTYGERRQDYKARSEAMIRAGTEKAPITSALAEIGSSFAVPVGGIAGATEEAVAGAAPSLGKTIPKAIGMGAEAGTYAGLGAAAEKAFGTEPESEKPDILSTAGIGAGIGAALPTGGAAIGKAFETLAPDWAQAFVAKMGGGDYQMTQFLKKVAADEAAGENVLGINGALKAIQDNPDAEINPFDVGGSRTQAWLSKAFKSRGDALDNFANTLAQRLDGAGDRFDSALLDAAGLNGQEFNLDRLKKESKDYAIQQNNLAYQAAHQPSNGRGLWNPQWENQFADENARDAALQVNNDLASFNGPKYVPPIGRLGAKSIDSLNLSGDTKAFLKSAGVNTLDDVAVQKANNYKSLFEPQTPLNQGDIARKALIDSGMPGSVVNSLDDQMAARIAKANNLKLTAGPQPLSDESQAMANEINKAMKGQNLDRLTLVNPNTMNVQWLDRYQQALNDIKEGMAQENLPRNMMFMNRLNAYKDQIVNGLKDPNSAYYNPAFAKAHDQAAQFHRTNSAFEAGQNFFRSLSNGANASALANATKTMDPTESRMFAQGMLGEIKYAATKNGKFEYNKINNWFNNPEMKKIMENTIGPQKLEKLQSILHSENILRQSLARASQLERMSGASTPGLLNNKDFLSLGIGYLLDTKLGISGYLYNHVLEPYMGRRYATRLRNMLESGDLTEMRRAYNQILSNPKIKTPFLDTVAHITAANLAQARTGMPSRKGGGRVKEEKTSRHPASMIPGTHIITAKVGEPVFSGRA